MSDITEQLLRGTSKGVGAKAALALEDGTVFFGTACGAAGEAFGEKMCIRDRIADVSGVHVIDAGDGKHQHPTQALLDLYTIWQTKGRLDGLKVGVVGDIGHSRVCGSLIPALKIMGCEVTRCV